MKEKLMQVKYVEWQASLWGACGIALALGASFSDYIKPVVPWLIIIGVVIHTWGMVKMHRRINQ